MDARSTVKGNSSNGPSDRQPASLKGKRKKTVPANANPLFTKWITEWKNEAIEKGWKSQYNYSKALRTLKMFPLCLETGKDCKMLQNFGDKICKMLDERLLEHKRNQDKGIADDSPQSTSLNASKPLVSVSNHPSSDHGAGSTSTIHAISDNSDSGREETMSPQKKKKRKSQGNGPREYVPAYRSGPYALILTMYRYSQDPDYKGFMTKAELIHAAQPLADKSFTIPDAGSHYTAWSSMGSLAKKMLVIKVGNPAKYHLTQDGADLGERLENAGKVGDNPQKTTACRDSRCDDSQNSSSIVPSKPALLSPLSSITTNLDDLDHLNLSAEERAFILEGVTPSVNSTSNNSFSVQTVSDVNPVYISDDEEPISCSSGWRERSPSHVLQAHSLSPSLSPPSSPEIGTVKEIECPVDKNLDNAKEFDKYENSFHDSICLMEYDDDDDVNFKNDSPQSPPMCLRLPPLSPSHSGTTLESYPKEILTHDPSSKSTKLDDSVIEIDDDDDDDNKFTSELSKNGVFHKVDFQSSQHSESYKDKKRKNIFNSVSQSSSQNSQSDDDDDLPDIDFYVPLSKRLLDKGAVSSQLLSQFTNDLDKPVSNNVCTVKTQKCKQVAAQQYSDHDKDIVILEDDVPESNRQCTLTASKIKSVEKIQKSDKNCEVTKSASHVQTPIVSNFEGLESPLESCPIPEFTLLPGSYEIVLCIDNREFYGSKSNSKTLLPDLMQSGVNCDLRLLHIGDILWVAREIGAPNEGPRAGRRELVLNFAIERKRMDDLVSSITGGRLKEQKFRLRHCGLSELIILIEEYGSIQNFSLSEDRIKQSIVNSQILDGFKVKRCGSSKEAVMYLSMMTRSIQKYYGNKTLHAASHEFVKSKASKSTIKDDELFLMPFETFNETSIKHKTLTVKEMFGKQLIQIPGVSLDRACAITKVYPSLVSLIRAYRNCTSEKSKEGLLATIKCGNKERNLGMAVSRMVHMMYNTPRLS